MDSDLYVAQLVLKLHHKNNLVDLLYEVSEPKPLRCTLYHVVTLCRLMHILPCRYCVHLSKVQLEVAKLVVTPGQS
jgi:hypothetical protein